MKIPHIKLHFYYSTPRVVNIRYGKGYDGVWFFEVVILFQHGCSYLFSSNHEPEWTKFCKGLNKFNIAKRLRVVRKVIKSIKYKMQENPDIVKGVTYKFKPKTLYKEL